VEASTFITILPLLCNVNSPNSAAEAVDDKNTKRRDAKAKNVPPVVSFFVIHMIGVIL